MTITIFIGGDLYEKLSEEEKNTFEIHERYKPDAIGEQLEYCERNDEEWSDEVFSDLDEYQEFWGGDFSEVGGDILKKEVGNETFENDFERFEMLSEQVKGEELGTQLRFIGSE